MIKLTLFKPERITPTEVYDSLLADGFDSIEADAMCALYAHNHNCHIKGTTEYKDLQDFQNIIKILETIKNETKKDSH